MKNIDSYGHVTGKSTFVDDIPVNEGTLYGCIYTSPIAHARIKSMDLAGAEGYEGVVGIFTAQDIPGENQVGGIIADETLLAEGSVHYSGQPVVLIVATSVIAGRGGII